MMEPADPRRCCGRRASRSPRRSAPRLQSAAQSWPTKPIRAIVPVAPGTGADVVSRLVFNQLSIQLGQQIVIENRGGAGGTIGAAAGREGRSRRLHDARPIDRRTSSRRRSTPTCPTTWRATSPRSRRSAAMPTALVMAPSKGIKTIAGVRRRRPRPSPAAFTFASAGVGSTTHLTAERFRLSAGFEAIHVPFRGGGFRPEIASGRVDFAFSPIAVAVAEHPRRPPAGARGQRAASASRRCPTCRPRWRPATRIPTTCSGSACSCRSKTPRAIVDRLHRRPCKALQTPALRERSRASTSSRCR